MAGADGDSPKAVQERVMAMSARAGNLLPVHTALAIVYQRQTANAFLRRTSPFGEVWLPLAPSTIRQRSASVRGGNRRNKRGRLTAGARAKRAAAIAAGSSYAPLIRTGRLRASIAYVPTREGIELSAVWYLIFHVTGALTLRHRLPKRNPLVVQRTSNGGGFALIPQARSAHLRAISSYITTGNIVLPAVA